ncbi:MAG: MBL fold metallo-hydrolase [Rhodococcus sp. (in: high G+C Gram-positive bacteria)]|nr:MAG: MBL fold metallo-hydrolase [Rhodococcus sp. (in: high G+C Gram-positive bacteria)]
MANHVNLTFHGAAKTVTGSCMEIESEGTRILVDCGLFQGSRSLETLNYGAFTFEPDTIEAVVLTHAHIDHCGLLPKLVAHGFEGPIFCTDQTSDLLEYMLADAGRIQEFEAQRRNQRRDRAGEVTIAPLYTEQDALTAWRQTRPVPLEEWFETSTGFRARLWNAGHILGAASAEVDAGSVRLLCSGDLGPQNKAFHADPEGPSGLDYVICESTYGSRTRVRLSIAQRRDLLDEEINKAISRGGNLVIPAFALERTQELLLDIAYLADANRIPNVPVFVDSPLANRATRVVARHSSELEDLEGKDIFRHPAIHYVDDASVSMRINSMSGVIIIAASGMCEAGRIRHHLAHNLHRRDSTILFVGFQAQGSLGRVILEGAKQVRISGTDVNVRADIRRIDSYSAHADQAELLDWIKERKPISGSLFLTHGEPGAISAMTELASDDDPALSIIAPAIGESYLLQSGAPAKLAGTARADAAELIGRDWQNDYAEFAVRLKGQLSRISDAGSRQKAIADMRKVLERYAEVQDTRQTRARD